LFGGALAQVVVALAVGWVLVGALLQWAGASARGEEPRRTLEGIGLPEHVLLGIAAFVALSAVAMVVHALGRGIVFANPVVVPVVGVAIVVWGVRRRSWPFSAPWILIAVGALILVAIFVTPVLLEGTGVRAGDSSLHMGWTEQLLRGESVPPGPAPEFGRNAYPWGFHAVMAMMVRLVPGTNTLVAQEARSGQHDEADLARKGGRKQLIDGVGRGRNHVRAVARLQRRGDEVRPLGNDPTEAGDKRGAQGSGPARTGSQPAR